jgi:hypothetical protein
MWLVDRLIYAAQNPGTQRAASRRFYMTNRKK